MSCRFNLVLCVIFLFTFFNCSQVDKKLLPAENILKLDNIFNISLSGYSVHRYNIINEVNLEEIKEYPNNEFSILHENDYNKLEWTLCNNLSVEETNYFVTKLKNANKPYDNEVIKDLIGKMKNRQNNIYFSGYYKVRESGKKFYHYIYVLDIDEKTILDFAIVF